MPNLTTHYICGKLIKDKLNITNPMFLKGCILPDYIENSHFRKPSKLFLTPDIDLFIEKNNFKNDYVFLGYLVHLLLDKYFIEDFVANKIYNKIDLAENIFTQDKIYHEYTLISIPCLNKYNIDLEEITLEPFENIPVDVEKFNNVIQDIKNNTEDILNLKYINLNEFFSFIEEVSSKICNDLTFYYKRILRNRIKEKRNNMIREEIDSKSQLIKDNLIAYLKNINNDSYLIYNSFGKEVSTKKIIEYLLENNKKVYLPRIKNDNLETILYTKETKLRKNKFNIEEPIGKHIELNNFICIMPLVAVSKNGNRIGMGKGYYDNYLKKKNCLKIGLCYDFQIVDNIFKEEHDVKLDIIISNDKIIKV